MSLKINIAQTWKLQLSLHESDRISKILVYNEARNIVHELEAASVPELVDYIRSDDRWGGLKTYVWGFIEDGLLVIENRMPDPGW